MCSAQLRGRLTGGHAPRWHSQPELCPQPTVSECHLRAGQQSQRIPCDWPAISPPRAAAPRPQTHWSCKPMHPPHTYVCTCTHNTHTQRTVAGQSGHSAGVLQQLESSDCPAPIQWRKVRLRSDRMRPLHSLAVRQVPVASSEPPHWYTRTRLTGLL